MCKALLLMALAVVGGEAGAKPVEPLATPLVIAHRGASADRPEHTLEAYRLAIAQGADFVEPDLVATKDGHLVARHENEIGGTTDVASRPEFAGRRTVKTIDGERVEGWFTEDFTLAEFKQLRARERLPQLRPANTAWDGKLEVPTLEEVIALVQAESKRSGRRIGIYPETKHPTYFRSIGLPLEERLVAVLHAAGYAKRTDPVFIQSFEVNNLKALRRMTDLPLVQLIAADGAPYDEAAAGTGLTYAAMITPEGLRAVSAYADAIGPEKSLVIPRRPDGGLGDPSCLVAVAHAEGLRVHPWTFRPENFFLPTTMRDGADPQARGRAAEELRAFLATGIDGLFSDSTEAAVGARMAR